MKDYRHEGETFQLDNSKGCYVAVTYRYLTGYVGVKFWNQATDKNPLAGLVWLSFLVGTPRILPVFPLLTQDEEVSSMYWCGVSYGAVSKRR